MTARQIDPGIARLAHHRSRDALLVIGALSFDEA